MKRNRNRIQLETWQDHKDKLLSKRKDTLEDITVHSIDASNLIKAKGIAEKLERGEYISEEEKSKLKEVKQQFESFTDDDDTTDTEGLKDAITYVKGEKQSLIDRDNELAKQTKSLVKAIKKLSKEENSKGSPLEEIKKENKGSLIDDYADLSSEIMDFMDE